MSNGFYKVEAILSEDGALTLRDLPFHAGDAVKVIILERSRSVSERESSNPVEKVEDRPESNLYPLRGTVLFYEDPFEPVIPVED
jgi:hypothetical protein